MEAAISRDGNGVYTLPQAPFVSGTTIESAKVNSNFSDLAAALTESLSKDGQTVPTGNQPMAGFKHTGVGVASSRTDYARADQVIGSELDYAADTGSATAYAIAPSPGIAAYGVGQRWAFKAANANSGADPTLAVNGLTAGIIYYPDGTSLAANDIAANSQVVVQVATLTTGTPTFHIVSPTAGLVKKGGTQTITGEKTFSATLAMSGAALNEAARVDVASATTCDIGAAASNYVRITGTTTITGLGTVGSGVRRHVVFGDALTLTHNGTSLILPNAGSNITTAAGDTALFISEGSGNWRCEDYQKADGTPLVAYTPPQRAYAYVTVAAGTATIQKQSGFTSVVRDAQGLFTCTLSSAMPDANYRVMITAAIDVSGGTPNGLLSAENNHTARSTTVFQMVFGLDSSGLVDPNAINIEVFA